MIKNYEERCVVVSPGKCVGCQQCYLYCPDGTVSIEDGKAIIDYDFCKGCGIFRKICRIGAIERTYRKL